MLLATMPAGSQLVELHQAASVPLCGHNVLLNLGAGLNQCDLRRVFICEYDCLYPASYFHGDLTPGHLNYAQDRWALFATFYHYKRRALSGLAGDRDFLRNAVLQKLRHLPDAGRWQVEMGTDIKVPIVMRRSQIGYVDIRHGRNFSGGGKRFREGNWRFVTTLPGWGDATELWKVIYNGQTTL